MEKIIKEQLLANARLKGISLPWHESVVYPDTKEKDLQIVLANDSVSTNPAKPPSEMNLRPRRDSELEK